MISTKKDKVSLLSSNKPNSESQYQQPPQMQKYYPSLNESDSAFRLVGSESPQFGSLFLAADTYIFYASA